jgi:peptide/nickel transport system substrate-binding protein
MRSRNRWTWFLGLAVLVGALALVAAGCGGGGKKSNSSTESTGSTSTGGGGSTGGQKKFAVFNVVYDTGTDYLDPALSYTVQGWGAMWHVYLPLLTYKDVAGPQGATVVPALAEALPTVTNGGKTYKLKLRSGLKYSDGKPVKASDFKYAIKRLFQIDSPGVGFFTNIVGADQFSKTKKGDISGIVTNDQTGDISVTLTAPQGDFQNILATTFAALVPAGTPPKDQSTHPIPSTGPYMIQSYQPNKQFVVVRNPQYKHIDGLPDGNPDKIVFKIVEDDAAALQQVINGQGDWDFHPIPTDRLASVQQKYGDRLKIYTPANTYYFFMNTRVKPFTDLKVRQAVNYAIDRQALVRIYGGLATPTQNVLPPTYPQYKKISMYAHDVAKAKQLVQQSGMAGMKVTVWGSNRATSKAPVEYYTDVLNKIGFKATPKIIDASIYWTTIGNQATKAQTGFADWFQDYPHPLDWFDVLLNGTRITQTHNNNYSNANVAAINKKINELKLKPSLDSATNDQWAQVDQMAAQNALWAPYVNRQFTDFFSSRIDTSCYINHVLYQFDYATICAHS